MSHFRKVKIDKNKLLNISDSERRFFIYGGHILNELYYFVRLIRIFQQSSSPLAHLSSDKLDLSENALRSANVVQSMITLKLFCGKIVETYKFLRECCFEKKWFLEVRAYYSKDEFLMSYGEIMEYFNEAAKNQNILYLLRDKFAFHYCRDAVRTSASKEVLEFIDEFLWYANDGGACTLFVGNEYSVFQSFFILSKRESMEKLFNDLLDDSLRMYECMQTFIDGIMLRMRDRYLEEGFEEEEFNVPWCKFEDIRLPFFTEIGK